MFPMSPYSFGNPHYGRTKNHFIFIILMIHSWEDVEKFSKEKSLNQLHMNLDIFWMKKDNGTMKMNTHTFDCLILKEHPSFYQILSQIDFLSQNSIDNMYTGLFSSRKIISGNSYKLLLQWQASMLKGLCIW